MKESTWGKIKNSLLLNILFFVVAALVGYGTYNMVRQTLSLSQESKDNVQKIEELTKKKKELEAYIAELESPQAIEREGKNRLNLKKPGEEVVVVVPEKNNPGDEDAHFWWSKLKSIIGL